MSIDETAAIPLARKHLQSLGVTAEAGNLANAAAVGITQMVWRNGPIEDAHAGARGRRNGLHDGVMFARNTWVYHQALTAVTSRQRYALLHFEERILDRDLVWPGTTDTLTRFGHGALGAIKRHTKQRVDYLLHLEETYPREEFWLLAAVGSLLVPGHFGMPRWEPRVRAAARRLRGEDPAFAEWLAHDYDRDVAALLATAPAIVREDVDEVERALLIAPYELGAAVLRWFAWNPVLLPLPAKAGRHNASDAEMSQWPLRESPE